MLKNNKKSTEINQKLNYEQEKKLALRISQKIFEKTHKTNVQEK